MPNIGSVLKAEIVRLSTRTTKAELASLKKSSAQYRRQIAALKRDIAGLHKQIGTLAKSATRGPKAAPVDADSKIRFRRDGLATHRKKLGVSAADYGKLVGVSGLTIYAWEKGKSIPRRAQLEKLVAVRGMGKREAGKRLEGTAEQPS